MEKPTVLSKTPSLGNWYDAWFASTCESLESAIAGSQDDDCTIKGNNWRKFYETVSWKSTCKNSLKNRFMFTLPM